MHFSSPRRLLLLAATALPQLALAVDDVVHLDYASYEGVSDDNGISKWLGIRYAAPPLGNLRFAEPQDPDFEPSKVDASEHGPICLDTKATLPEGKSSEDCLYLDVYAPSSASSQKKLPVYVFLQGGGFQANSNYNYDGTGLISASNDGIVVVTLNYRVGPYGFLASKEVAKGGSLNNGLKDQRKALQWVQKYISKFGGDPNHVVLGGASAGASSVTLHLTAYGGRNDGLFVGTTSESQAMGVLLNVDQSQFVYDALVSRTGCGKHADTLGCLRGLSTDALQSKNIVIPYSGNSEAGLYIYGPTIDGDLIQDYTPNLLAAGKYIRVPAIFGDDTNEGTVFTPRNTSSQSDSSRFLKNNFPDLTSDQLSHIAQMYPVDNTPSYSNSGRYWRQAADAFGELRYVCPGLLFTRTWAKNVPVWNYRWNVVDPATESEGYGSSHTKELAAIWGTPYITGSIPASYGSGGVNAPVAAKIQQYWISFIKTLNPNSLRQPGSAAWTPVLARNFATRNLSPRRLRFDTGDSAVMEGVPADQQARCAYFDGIALGLKQ